MPRKRSVSDEAILDRALGLAESAGPAALTFSALSAEVGLAPATLVQRFGTKAKLLQAALLRAWDHLDEATAGADAGAGDGPEGVVDLVTRLSGQYDPAEDADQILLLREDLRDPVLRARGQAWIATLAAAIEGRLEGAPPGVGRLVVAQWQGSLTVWQFHREGDLAVALGTAVASLLTALGFPVTPPRPGRRSRGTPPPR
ncbi:MAG TPA: helix-turn-helix domain-containing protein [Acidimicrobiales bacterium]|jgi:AcrR family transcriptional regulator|nr:helix-turn-helix domain-containing protein [Acidimicrobiales bacterium]